MSSLAEQRIRKNLESKSPELNLRSCNLDGTESFLALLLDSRHLQSLNLRGNQIHDISFLKGLINLQSLNLRHNQIHDISFLQDLINLQSLNLSSNQIHDISFLQDLINLQSLDLRDNQIHDISFLEGLINLQSLNLSGNQIHDISFLQDLINLKSLDLSYNQIHDISFLKGLINLQSLDLSINQIHDISFLEGLINLQSLDLRYNQIHDISFLQDLSNLQSLDLGGNQIHDISFLQDLSNLQSLDLIDNQIHDISLGFIKQFPHLEYLYLSNNPLQNIPFEIYDQEFGNALPDVRNYLEDLSKGAIKVYQSKIILIGNGRVGKTCLVKRWLDDTFDPNEPSTHAIQLRKAFLPELATQKDLDYIQLNIWDFGGQDIYHATHQLFMQSKAVFLLLWDEDNEPENTPQQKEVIAGQEVTYQNLSWRAWLDYIQAASKNSPVLVIQTKKDLHDEQDLPQKQSIDKKVYNIKHFLSIDSANDDEDENGFDDFNFQLQKIIKQEIKKSCTDLPKTWWKAQQTLAELTDKQIPLHQFEKICLENEVPQKSLDTLSKYLHDTGFFFYQEHLFDNQIILDQKWAIDAVYTLFDRTQRFSLFRFQRNGIFEGKDLIDIWQDHRVEEQLLFLSFMESCQICVEVGQQYVDDQEEERVPFEQRAYLAPQLLPDEPIPNQQDIMIAKKGLYFKFKHHFLHSAVIQRLIIATVHLAKRENIKAKRILIEIANQQALVEAFPAQNEIIIRIVDTHSIAILNDIKATLKEIQQGISGIEEMVSIDGEGYVRLSQLEKNLKNKTIEADNGEMYPVEKFSIFLNKERKYYIQSSQTQNPNPMHEAIQNALNHLENANFAGYFEEMDKVKGQMPGHLKPIYATHKNKFIAGQKEWDFHQQLATFAKEIAKSALQNTNTPDSQTQTIIQKAEKIYNIQHIDKADFS